MLARVARFARFSIVAVLACSCLPPPPVEEHPRAQGRGGTHVDKRVVISQTRPSGYFTTTTYANGMVGVVFHVVENGRGPHVEANVTLAADWTIAGLNATGKHTMGTKVAETFVRAGDHATWNSEEEHGDQQLQGAAFFIPMADMPIAWLLVPAALKAGGSIPLLPSGKATVTKVAEVDVTAAGHKRHLIGYGIQGLSFSTVYTWFDADGAWFGDVSPFSSVVPEGWESVIDPLIAKQEELDRAHGAELARTLSTRPVTGLALTNVRVLDVEKGTWTPGQTVLVIGDTIKAIGPVGRVKIPDGVDSLPLDGLGVMPGLIDMHAHLDTPDGLLDLASGVTTVRDVGNDPDKLDDLTKRFDDGSAIGPHVLRMGFIEGRNEKAASSKITAETPDEAKAAVEFYAKRGYDGIKIYNSVRPELVPLLAADAHLRGMLVTGHIPVHMIASEAVAAGYDGIEHINMLFLNFFATKDTDTRDTTRFTLVGDKAAEFALDGKPVLDFFEQLRSKKTVIDPTLGAFQELFIGIPGKITPGLEDVAARMPPQVARGFLAGGLPMDETKRILYARSWDKILAMVKALWQAKITLVTGTDHIAGLMLHNELALFVKAGIPTKDVLRMATLDAAKALRLDKKIGTVAVGKRADLAIVDGDPIADIKAVRKITFAMRSGVLYRTDALFKAVGVTP